MFDQVAAHGCVLGVRLSSPERAQGTMILTQASMRLPAQRRVHVCHGDDSSVASLAIERRRRPRWPGAIVATASRWADASAAAAARRGRAGALRAAARAGARARCAGRRLAAAHRDDATLAAALGAAASRAARGSSRFDAAIDRLTARALLRAPGAGRAAWARRDPRGFEQARRPRSSTPRTRSLRAAAAMPPAQREPPCWAAARERAAPCSRAGRASSARWRAWPSSGPRRRRARDRRAVRAAPVGLDRRAGGGADALRRSCSPRAPARRACCVDIDPPDATRSTALPRLPPRARCLRRLRRRGPARRRRRCCAALRRAPRRWRWSRRTALLVRRVRALLERAAVRGARRDRLEAVDDARRARS